MTMTAQEMIQFVDDLYEATGTGNWEKAALRTPGIKGATDRPVAPD